MRHDFLDLNYKEATAKAKLGTLFKRRETLCQTLFSQIETKDFNERHKLNFGTYYQLSMDHVIMNGGIKEFTRCY